MNNYNVKNLTVIYSENINLRIADKIKGKNNSGENFE